SALSKVRTIRSPAPRSQGQLAGTTPLVAGGSDPPARGRRRHAGLVGASAPGRDARGPEAAATGDPSGGGPPGRHPWQRATVDRSRAIANGFTPVAGRSSAPPPPPVGRRRSRGRAPC